MQQGECAIVTTNMRDNRSVFKPHAQTYRIML